MPIMPPSSSGPRRGLDLVDLASLRDVSRDIAATELALARQRTLQIQLAEAAARSGHSAQTITDSTRWDLAEATRLVERVNAE